MARQGLTHGPSKRGPAEVLESPAGGHASRQDLSKAGSTIGGARAPPSIGGPVAGRVPAAGTDLRRPDRRAARGHPPAPGHPRRIAGDRQAGAAGEPSPPEAGRGSTDGPRPGGPAALRPLALQRAPSLLRLHHLL